MAQGKEHEVVRDATLTLAHVLKTQLSARLGNKGVEVVFDFPDDKAIDAAAKAGKVLVSVVLIDTVLSKDIQTTEQPVIRDEDDDGNIVEYRLAPPTSIKPRYLVTPWNKDPLEGQATQGLIMQAFFDYPQFAQEDLQGDSISPDDRVPVNFDESLKMEHQLQLWQAMQRPYRASLVYTLSLRLGSAKRTAIRRVKERVLDYRKVEG